MAGKGRKKKLECIFMNGRDIKAFLFDFDGVVCNTEHQYDEFWARMNPIYFNDPELCTKVKGTTFESMIETFSMDEATVGAVRKALDELEANMDYSYVPGALEFIKESRRRGYKTALVTSSDSAKLAQIYAHRPELRGVFDVVLISSDFAHSKPDPECFLKAMATLGVSAEQSVVFEDSVNGLKAGRDSGALVVGLVTSNPEETVKKYSTYQIKDFKRMSEIFDFLS